MKFSFTVEESGICVRIDQLTVGFLDINSTEWEALKQILGAGAVAMQMQGQDIQVEVK